MNPPKRVLITGAGSGLGQALAHRFAAAGAQVACVDIQAERTEATLAALKGSGHAAFVADVGDDASMQALADAVLAGWGAPDVLINNAGIASGGDVLEAPISEWRHLWEVNVLSVVRGSKLFLPAMLKRGSGHVVSTASFAGLAGAPIWPRVSAVYARTFGEGSFSSAASAGTCASVGFSYTRVCTGWSPGPTGSAKLVGTVMLSAGTKRSWIGVARPVSSRGAM